jgi:RNA polymerase sigma factor (TIGR02999 family)
VSTTGRTEGTSEPDAGAPRSPEDITRLIEAVSGGDAQASSDLLPVVYGELRRLARSRMGLERGAQTLQPTALVHEAFMRLIGPSGEARWDNRGHFFASAALAMRRILVERARHRGRIRHGGGHGRVELSDDLVGARPETTDLVSLDEVLEALEQFDQRKAEVVMLRYFAGLSIEETAAAMDLSAATVKNEWAFARAWLRRELVARGIEPSES